MAVVRDYFGYAGPRWGNDWLFLRQRFDPAIANSISTIEAEEAERAVAAEYRNRHRRPLTEWSDLADPFEPAASEDWSPVRSVRLSTPGTKPAARPKPKRPRLRGVGAYCGPKIEDIPEILTELRAQAGEKAC